MQSHPACVKFQYYNVLAESPNEEGGENEENEENEEGEKFSTEVRCPTYGGRGEQWRSRAVFSTSPVPHRHHEACKPVKKQFF